MSKMVTLERFSNYVRGGISFEKGIPTLVDDDRLADDLLSTGAFQIWSPGGLVSVHPVLDESGKDPISELFNVGNPLEHAKNSIASDDDLNGKRILLRRYGGVGDALFVVTVADSIKKRFPKSFIAL